VRHNRTQYSESQLTFRGYLSLMFLGNVSWISLGHAALYPKKIEFFLTQLWEPQPLLYISNHPIFLKLFFIKYFTYQHVTGCPWLQRKSSRNEGYCLSRMSLWVRHTLSGQPYRSKALCVQRDISGMAILVPMHCQVIRVIIDEISIGTWTGCTFIQLVTTLHKSL
jgi:hypothetical protein